MTVLPLVTPDDYPLSAAVLNSPDPPKTTDSTEGKTTPETAVSAPDIGGDANIQTAVDQSNGEAVIEEVVKQIEETTLVPPQEAAVETTPAPPQEAAEETTPAPPQEAAVETTTATAEVEPAATPADLPVPEECNNPSDAPVVPSENLQVEEVAASIQESVVAAEELSAEEVQQVSVKDESVPEESVPTAEVTALIQETVVAAAESAIQQASNDEPAAVPEEVPDDPKPCAPEEVPMNTEDLATCDTPKTETEEQKNLETTQDKVLPAAVDVAAATQNEKTQKEEPVKLRSKAGQSKGTSKCDGPPLTTQHHHLSGWFISCEKRCWLYLHVLI